MFERSVGRETIGKLIFGKIEPSLKEGSSPRANGDCFVFDSGGDIDRWSRDFFPQFFSFLYPDSPILGRLARTLSFFFLLSSFGL